MSRRAPHSGPWPPCCGIVLAAGISWATSQLTGQHIGLASEPITSGRRLAPPASATPSRQATKRARTAPHAALPPPPRSPPASETPAPAPSQPLESAPPASSEGSSSRSPSGSSRNRVGGEDETRRQGSEGESHGAPGATTEPRKALPKLCLGVGSAWRATRHSRCDTTERTADATAPDQRPDRLPRRRTRGRRARRLRVATGHARIRIPVAHPGRRSPRSAPR